MVHLTPPVPHNPKKNHSNKTAEKSGFLHFWSPAGRLGRPMAFAVYGTCVCGVRGRNAMARQRDRGGSIPVCRWMAKFLAHGAETHDS